jgi:hypothetical protein
MIESLVQFLEPIYYLTTMLSAEKYPPCSLINPSIEKLKAYYHEKKFSKEIVIKCKFF